MSASLLGLVVSSMFAQEAKPPQAPSPSEGQVLIQSHGAPPPLDSGDDAKGEEGRLPTLGLKLDGTELSDRERSAIRILAYDLDVRFKLADHAVQARAKLKVVNKSATPITRLALQVSSTLQWDAISVNGTQLPLVQHALDTDADHTGRATEAVVTLAQPLAPGGVLALDTFYSGTLAANTGRLQRIGVSEKQAAQTDWDVIGAEAGPVVVALRGFGNILWLPVSTPQLFLGDGAELFHAIGSTQLEERAATVKLRLAVESDGPAPAAAYFCGRRSSFQTAAGDTPVTATIATTSFGLTGEPMQVGFRPMSLFVLDKEETRIAPLPDGGDAAPMLAVATADTHALPRMADAAVHLAPLVQQWFGPRPLTALTVLDHGGSPFEDGPLVVAPMAALAGSTSSSALLQGLTHAWVATGQPWVDDGLAQFLSLLLTEQEQGRERAVAELEDLLQPLTLAEPGAESFAADARTQTVGQPLILASDEIYYRRKAAAVWWMLRDLAGEPPLRQALSAWRVQPISTATPEAQARDFEHLLERTSGKDLAWFFNDWVLRDRGLPDLTIVNVVPRQLPAGAAHAGAWLVSVTVRNDGAAAAQVPLVIRAGSFSITHSLQVAGLSDVTERVLIEAAPTEVLLNDGSVPEVRSSRHSRDVVVKLH